MLPWIARLLESNLNPRRVTTEQVIQRAQDSFGDIYFVGLGIFQSIIAAKLFDKVFELIDYGGHLHNLLMHGKWDVASLEVVRIAISATTIVFVMFSYYWWVSFVRTRPRVRDIVLPFAMGACQFAQVHYISSEALWGLSVGLFGFVAFFALLNSVRRLFEVHFIKKTFELTLWKSLVGKWTTGRAACAVAGAVIGIGGFALWQWRPEFVVEQQSNYKTLYELALACCLLVYRWCEQRFLIEVQEKGIVCFE